MKKIMFALVAILATCFVEGATMTWSALNVKTPADSTVAADNGWMALWFDSTAVTAADVSAAFAAGDMALAASATYTATTASGKVSSSGNGNYSAGDTVSGFAVIFDSATAASASNFIITGVKSATVNALGGNITLAYGNMASATWTAVEGAMPEPTSGLLLLIGGAMLALRRKQK